MQNKCKAVAQNPHCLHMNYYKLLQSFLITHQMSQQVIQKLFRNFTEKKPTNVLVIHHPKTFNFMQSITQLLRCFIPSQNLLLVTILR